MSQTLMVFEQIYEIVVVVYCPQSSNYNQPAPLLLKEPTDSSKKRLTMEDNISVLIVHYRKPQ